MSRIKTFESFDRERYIKKFKELKASGKPFTLADTLRDEDGNLPDLPTLDNYKKSKEFADLSNDIDYLKPYHDEAKKFDTNPSVRVVGDIKTVKTSIGNFLGFYVKGRNIIFYHPGSLAVLVEKIASYKHDNTLSEISLDEVELLFK
jgi:hypothetical protein